MASTIWLAHVTVYDPNISGEKTLYLSSSSYVSGTTNLPPGGSAHTYYDPRIKQPANMRRDIFKAATTFGASSVGYGAMELINNDGGMDDILNYGLDGRRITIILGQCSMGSTPVWTTIFTGTMEQPEISWTSVTIRIRDRQFELDVPINKNTYGGTNALPNGLDGVVGDLKGKVKPVLLGKVYNIAPPMVNTSRLIYQVNDGAIYTVDAVYDKGAALTKGADYTSQSDMETNIPAAGYYRVWPAGGYFRLGSSPVGQVTADATQSATNANMTVAQLIKYAVSNYTTVSGSDINASDVSALDIINNNVVGLYSDAGSLDVSGVVSGSTTVKDCCDQLANSIGAWYSFDTTGALRMKQFAAPSSPASVDIVASDIISIDRMASNDPGRGVAAWRIRYNYKKIYTTQDNDLAGSVTDARRSELKLEYRTVEASNSAVKTKHPLAPELTMQSLLNSSSAASAEATRLLGLYSVDRSVYDIRLAYDADLISDLDLGVIIKLSLDRFGMSAGKYFMVIGIRPDYRLKLVDITVWG